MSTQIIRKRVFRVTDVRAIGRLIPREFLCVIGVYREYLVEAPELHRIIPARKFCGTVTDVLCNQEINSDNKNVCVVILGPVEIMGAATTVTVIHYPPPRKYYENNSPRIFLCNFWGRLRQNCVITKKLIPQELFCVIGDRRDLRLVHVELREIYVTPKKLSLGEIVFVIDYAKPSQSPRK